MARREGSDPAVHDRRGRDLRRDSRLQAATGPHRTAPPASSPGCGNGCCLLRSGSARRAGRSRRPSTSTSTCGACGCPNREPSARSSTCCNRSRPPGFDRARPLWEFTLIEGLTGADGTERSAFAMKVHHSVTDGVGGMALLAQLVDLTPDATQPVGRHACEPGAGIHGRSSDWSATRSCIRRAGCWA